MVLAVQEQESRRAARVDRLELLPACRGEQGEEQIQRCGRRGRGHEARAVVPAASSSATGVEVEHLLVEAGTVRARREDVDPDRCPAVDAHGVHQRKSIERDGVDGLLHGRTFLLVLS